MLLLVFSLLFCLHFCYLRKYNSIVLHILHTFRNTCAFITYFADVFSLFFFFWFSSWLLELVLMLPLRSSTSRKRRWARRWSSGPPNDKGGCALAIPTSTRHGRTCYVKNTSFNNHRYHRYLPLNIWRTFINRMLLPREGCRLWHMVVDNINDTLQESVCTAYQRDSQIFKEITESWKCY